MSVGENIKTIRQLRAISIERFSALTGISVENCNMIEAGARALNSSEVQIICRVLGVNFDALLAAPKQDEQEDNDGSVPMPAEELENLLGKMRDE